MRKGIQLISGQVFNNLIFIKEKEREISSNGKKIRKGLFKCKCGNEIITRISSVISNNTTSCGCFRMKRIKEANSKHGLRNIDEYSVWASMIQRCTNINNEAYNNYGGRGIKVCQSWLNSFEEFYKDMGRRPTNKHTLERINNKKGYCKSNCKWDTRKNQNNNRRSNVFITYNNETLTLTNWAKKLSIAHRTLRMRLKRWPLELALTIPKNREKRYIVSDYKKNK